jgi:hypothetical protein
MPAKQFNRSVLWTEMRSAILKDFPSLDVPLTAPDALRKCVTETADWITELQDKTCAAETKLAKNIDGPAQEPDPLTSNFAKALEEHRESIPVAVMDHIDKLQRQIDFSRGGKFGPPETTT